MFVGNFSIYAFRGNIRILIFLYVCTLSYNSHHAEVLQPPIDIRWMVTNPGQLTFAWSPVQLECPGILYYSIVASNCGSCPSTTTNTITVCTDEPSNDGLCKFALQTVICGNITGNLSDPVYVQQKGTVITVVIFRVLYNKKNTQIRHLVIEQLQLL